MVIKRIARFVVIGVMAGLIGFGCLPQAATPTPLPVVIPGETPPMVTKLDLEVLAPTHLEIGRGECVGV